MPVTEGMGVTAKDMKKDYPVRNNYRYNYVFVFFVFVAAPCTYSICMDSAPLKCTLFINVKFCVSQQSMLLSLSDADLLGTQGE